MLYFDDSCNRVIIFGSLKIMIIKNNNVYNIIQLTNNGGCCVLETYIPKDRLLSKIADRYQSAFFEDTKKSVLPDIRPGQKYKYNHNNTGIYTAIKAGNNYAIISEQYVMQSGCENLTQEELNSKFYRDGVIVLN